MQSSDPRDFFRAEADLAAAEARRLKAESTRDIGSPINVTGKPLAIEILGSDVWVAHSDAVIRRINLESGIVSQVYRGHAGPVTALALVDSSKTENPWLISGSWDKTIKLWNTREKSIISSTAAHTDFVKCLLYIPELHLLVSGGSDKIVRFWDLTSPHSQSSLISLGFLSAHTRPIQCLSTEVHSEKSATLYTADSMGTIIIWELERSYGDSPNCRGTQKGELWMHRTGINDMWLGQGQLFTASTDETVILHQLPLLNTQNVKPIPPLQLPKPVKALLPLALTALGEPFLLVAYNEVIRLYDISTIEEPEQLSEVDVHSHDVTALRLWVKKEQGLDQVTKVEPIIVSASLDGTIRRWKLAEFIKPSNELPNKEEVKKGGKANAAVELTPEEEEELAELLDED